MAQVAVVQVPALRTEDVLEHARHDEGPVAEQEEQDASHAWQLLLVVSKNCDLLHVGRQRPLERTGLEGGQLEHCVKEPPEQDAQSG